MTPRPLIPSYRSWGGAIARLLTLLAILPLVGASAGAAFALEIIVPAYFYPSPGSDWGRMTAALDQAPITAIMNPGNGPGANRDANYDAVTDAFTTAGGNLIGYVYSSYGARPLNQVLTDIDRYAQWYPIEGIFVDEFTNTSDPAVLDYYNAIYEHVKGINPEWEVMGNPGTTTVEAYLTRPTADRLMVWENFGSTYPGHTPSAWNADYDSTRFVNLLHTLASGDTAASYVDLAVERNVGGVYFTDDVLGNPWDRLPTYWDQFVAKVAAVNNRVEGPLQTLSNFVADGAIVIDAPRDGWAGVAAFDADPAGDTPAALDIDSVTIANDTDDLFIRLTFNAGNGQPAALGSAHRIYLDTDGDRGTGYYGDGGAFAIGADYLVLNNRLYGFQGKTQGTFSWNFLQDIPADATTTDDIEWSLPLAAVGGAEGFDFLVQTNDAAGPDYVPDAAATGALGNAYRYEIATPPLAGDYDADGDVDLADYSHWLARYGSVDTTADGNGDGAVDAADYTVWRDAYAATTSAKAVPEPSSAVMLFTLKLIDWRRRHAATRY
ncbi:spherulation-specific family 4 protein [Botrimarina mediterranea]|uniref:Spherulation-specific family 4 n=1 Tax=Botrimarina mediterranea TaxID=2528022 RepID=A0A518K856_9BACT|nr:spherulation-specific family 4 protein [Botrimarina mediterranea]QDV73981.1 Spherulation-specific family 4 [Botrimarina mediterranea]QDV78611.1 Spherulation-specific family 4 [Planctomycetes bacterium K2D]